MKTSKYLNALHCIVIALKSGWLSLLSIIAVIILTVNVEQGQALILNLFDQNFGNLLLFLFQVLFMAMIVSHYPNYLELYFENVMHKFDWKLNQPVILGMGIVTYQYKKDQKWESDCDLGIWRKLLGVLFLSICMYAFTETYYLQISQYANSISPFLKIHGFWSFTLIFVFNVLMYLLFRYLFQSFTKVPRLIDLLILLFALGIAALSVYINEEEKGWSAVSSVLIVICMLLLNAAGIILIYFRSYTLLKNHAVYLTVLSVFGWINFIILVWANFQPHLFNPLIIIMAFLNLFYGLFVIVIKHRFYYGQKGITQSIYRVFFNYLAPILIILIPIWYLVAEVIGNDLHALKVIPESTEVSSYQDFKRNFKDKWGKSDTLYFIAAYGGGLKANIWNQYVLEKCRDLNGKDLLACTVAISGVSGGSIGNAVYAAINHEQLPERRKAIIDSVGLGNFLTVDLAYMFGHDMFANLMGTWLFGKGDRAYRSMKSYQDMVLAGTDFQGTNKLLNTSFRGYWQEMNRDKNYPVLLINSSGKNSRKGVAASLKFSEAEFKACFKNTDDILSLANNQTLSYLEATSTSNRFPVLSPAAKIPGKGHYVDGGYFENSGMQSLMEFYEFLLKDKLLEGKKIVFIQISNSGGVSLHNLTKDLVLDKEIKESSELGAVINTKLSLDFLPYYYSDFSEIQGDTLKIVRIDMPHFYTDEKLKAFFDSKLVPQSSRLDSLIKTNNESIKKIRSQNPFNYLEPPLSRLLSRQSLNYMKDCILIDNSFNQLK